MSSWPAAETQPQNLALAFQALVTRASLAAGPLLVRRRFGIRLVIRHSRSIEHEVAVPYRKGSSEVYAKAEVAPSICAVTRAA